LRGSETTEAISKKVKNEDCHAPFGRSQ